MAVPGDGGQLDFDAQQPSVLAPNSRLPTNQTYEDPNNDRFILLDRRFLDATWFDSIEPPTLVPTYPKYHPQPLFDIQEELDILLPVDLYQETWQPRHVPKKQLDRFEFPKDVYTPAEVRAALWNDDQGYKPPPAAINCEGDFRFPALWQLGQSPLFVIDVLSPDVLPSRLPAPALHPPGGEFFFYDQTYDIRAAALFQDPSTRPITDTPKTQVVPQPYEIFTYFVQPVHYVTAAQPQHYAPAVVNPVQTPQSEGQLLWRGKETIPGIYHLEAWTTEQPPRPKVEKPVMPTQPDLGNPRYWNSTGDLMQWLVTAPPVRTHVEGMPSGYETIIVPPADLSITITGPFTVVAAQQNAIGAVAAQHRSG